MLAQLIMPVDGMITTGYIMYTSRVEPIAQLGCCPMGLEARMHLAYPKSKAKKEENGVDKDQCSERWIIL